MNPATGSLAESVTALTALGRYAQGDEIASLVANFRSPESAYFPGASLTIDGGFAA